MQSVCFPLFFAADDRVRLLTKPEKADFAFHFCPLAAMNRRQPGIIPAMPLPMLAKKLGLDKKVVLKRLVRLSAPGIELIDIQYDTPEENGELSLLSCVSVEVLDFAEWNGLDEDWPDAPLDAAGDLPPRGPAGQNGNGSGNVHRSNGIARSSNATRQARYRARNGQGRPSTDTRNGNSNAFDAESNALALQNGSQSVMPEPEKSAESDASEALRSSRAGDDNDQRYGLDLESKNLNTDSETLNVTNVGNALPVTPPSVTPPQLPRTNVSQNGTSKSPPPNPKSPPPNPKSPPPNLRGRSLAAQSVALAQELRDVGSESRHYQLLAICEEHSLPDLATQALRETRRRMDNPRRQQVEKPGAYYQAALLRKLAEHNVHVPTRAQLEAEPASEVQRLIRESLAEAMPPGYTPLEELPGYEEEE